MSNYGKWYIYPDGPCLKQFFGIEIKPVYTKFAVFEQKDFFANIIPCSQVLCMPKCPTYKNTRNAGDVDRLYSIPDDIAWQSLVRFA